MKKTIDKFELLKKLELYAADAYEQPKRHGQSYDYCKGYSDGVEEAVSFIERQIRRLES